MGVKFASAVVAAFTFAATIVAQNVAAFWLGGDRFRPLTYEELTPPQKFRASAAA
jgi:hypothetical protein